MKTPTMLPKSLHTVTALSAVAEYVRATVDDCDDAAAMQIALSILGYAEVPDPYGLAVTAIRKVGKTAPAKDWREEVSAYVQDSFYIHNR